MSDPQRLLQDTRDLTAPERRALEAARDVRPPADFAGGVWSALASRLPGAPTVPDGSGGGASAGSTGAGAAGAAGAVGAGTVKALLVGAVIGVAVVGGRAIWPAGSPSTESPARADHSTLESRTVAAPAAVESPGEERATPEATPPAMPAELGPSPRTGSPRVEVAPRPTFDAPGEARGSRAAALVPTTESSRNEASRPSAASGGANPVNAADAREESRLVATARDALRAGAPSQSLALLEQARQRFPAGTLLQEREALTIEALAGAGQRATAIERARAFARDYPGSPYTARVQAILAAP